MTRVRLLLLLAAVAALSALAFASDLWLHPPTPAETGEVAPGIYALRDGTVNAWAVEHLPAAGVPAPPPRERNLFLVDAGLTAASMEAELRSLGLAPERVTHILLTHSDRDHVGLLAALPSAEIILHADEIPMTDGTLKRAFGLFRNLPLPRPARAAADREPFAIGGRAVTCVAAPGHTAGHCAWRIGDMLFAGDAFLLDASGAPRPFWRLFHRDGRTARESAARLLAYARETGVARILTGHSGWAAAGAAGNR